MLHTSNSKSIISTHSGSGNTISGVSSNSSNGTVLVLKVVLYVIMDPN